jgi:Ca-activated chloride channel family protein
MSKHKISFSINSDLDLIASEVPSQRILEFAVRAPQAAQRVERISLNLGLVIDRSGSMLGEKLAYVKEAANHVLDLLTERDRVTIIAYDDTIRCVSESVPVTSLIRQELKNSVNSLQAGNMTNLSDGWLQGCQNVAAVLKEGQLNRVLLLTDGLANVGITDLEELGHHASQLHSRGVSTSTFGVGEGFNEYLLEQMANQGGGNFYFIEHPQTIPQIFMRELKELAAVTARDVQITVEVPPQVNIQVFGGWKHELNNGILTICLGDLAACTQREVYVKLLTPPQSEKEQLVIRADVKAIGESEYLYQEQEKIILRYAPQTAVQTAPLQKEVIERFGVVEVAEIAGEALRLERAGEKEKASRLLQQVVVSNAGSIPAPAAAFYRDLSERMKDGLSERDRKNSYQTSYTQRQRRG